MNNLQSHMTPVGTTRVLGLSNLAKNAGDHFQRMARGERVIASLLLGHDVDQRLTRQAAEDVFGARLRYAEDSLYAQQPDTLAAVIAAQW